MKKIKLNAFHKGLLVAVGTALVYSLLQMLGECDSDNILECISIKELIMVTLAVTGAYLKASPKQIKDKT